MYRAFLCFALLAFCSSAPYGDVNAPRTFPVRQEQQFIQQQPLFQQQTVTVPRIQHHQQQQDQTDLVDTLGGGYSFFKKQPIVSRPLIQQKMAISEQQVPIVSLDDTTNQWSDYTKASAFKQLPIQKQQVSVSNDLLVGGGYGQQQQQDLGIQMSLAPKTLVSERQGAYGSALAQDQQGLQQIVQQQPIIQQQQPSVRNFDSGYGQQNVQTFAQEQQPIQVLKPLIRNLENSYGQQETQTIVQQQPLVRNLDNGYGQQNVQTFAQEQQPIQVLKPLIRNLGNSYGQQETQTIVQQQPLVRSFDSGYGQQNVQTFAQEQQPVQILKPLIRNLGNSYGQQETQTFVQQQPLVRNFDSGYGQQNVQTFAQEQQPVQILRPVIRNLENSYGQQQQQQPLGASVQFNQPTFSAHHTEFSHQTAPVMSSRVISQSQVPVQSSDSGSFRGW